MKDIIKQLFCDFFQSSFFIILNKKNLYPDGTFTFIKRKNFSQSLPEPVNEELHNYVEIFCKKLTTFLFNELLIGVLFEISEKVNLHERYFFRFNGNGSEKFFEDFDRNPTMDKLLGLTNLLRDALLKINSFEYDALCNPKNYEWNISLGMNKGTYKEDNLLGPFKGDPDWNNFPWDRFGHKAIYNTLQSSLDKFPGVSTSYKRKTREKYNKRLQYSAENTTLKGICSVELSEEYTLDFYKLKYLKYSV